MSLDVYLIVNTPVKAKQSSGIFIREGGQTKEISAEEWNKRNPGMEPVTLEQEKEEEINTVFRGNITHNLNKMASECGIYYALWRPEGINVSTAGQLIQPLTEAITRLKSQPDWYKQYNPQNGWGSYEGLIEFLENYLNACKEYPDALVEVSR